MKAAVRGGLAALPCRAQQRHGARVRRAAARASSAPATAGDSQNYPTPALFTAARAAMGATRAALSAVSAAAAPEQLRSNLSVSAAAALPLVACLGAGSTVPLITSSIASFIKLYLLLLFVRVLLSWFPNVDWMGQPWLTLRQVTDPYLSIFRNLIPPLMGQIDFTPILGFLVLQFVAQVLSGGPQTMDIM